MVLGFLITHEPACIFKKISSSHNSNSIIMFTSKTGGQQKCKTCTHIHLNAQQTCIHNMYTCAPTFHAHTMLADMHHKGIHTHTTLCMHAYVCSYTHNRQRHTHTQVHIGLCTLLGLSFITTASKDKMTL